MTDKDWGGLLPLRQIPYTLYAMQWIRAHKYTVALICTAILVLVGGITAKNEMPRAPTERGGVKNVAVEYPYYVPPVPETGNAENAAKQNPQNVEAGADDFIPSRTLFFGRTAQPEASAVVENTPNPKSAAVVEQEPEKPQNISLDDTYLRFFQALANILSPADTRTAEQKVLFSYGNTAGSLIKAFEDTHRDTSKILKTFFDTHTDTSKAAGIPEIAGTYARLTGSIPPVSGNETGASSAAKVQAISEEYIRLSAAIGNIREVPPQAETANAKLAQGYAGVAQGLSKLSQAGNDTQLLEAISAYNATADEFIKNYVFLVKLFSAYGVKFGANDPGAVFSFSATGGL